MMIIGPLGSQVPLRDGLGAYFWWSLSVVDVFVALCWLFFQFLWYFLIFLSCFCIFIGFWSFWALPRHQKEVHRSCFSPFGSVLGAIWGRPWEFLRVSWATKRPRCPQESPRPPQEAPRPPQMTPQTLQNLQNGHPDIPKEPPKSNPKDHQHRNWKITFDPVRILLFFYILGSTVSEVFDSTILQPWLPIYQVLICYIATMLSNKNSQTSKYDSTIL